MDIDNHKYKLQRKITLSEYNAYLKKQRRQERFFSLVIWVTLIAAALIFLGHITARIVKANQPQQWLNIHDSAITEPLEDRLRMVALDIARCYSLSRGQAILLLAIHDHEDGKKAEKEFGIDHQKEKIPDRIERYCRYACKSALSIKRFCPDVDRRSINRFGRGFGNGKRRYQGYAEDPQWGSKVYKAMKKYREILY